MDASTPSQELLLSFIVQGVIANGYNVNFLRGQKYGSVVLEIVDKNDNPSKWVCIGEWDGKFCVVDNSAEAIYARANLIARPQICPHCLENIPQ